MKTGWIFILISLMNLSSPTLSYGLGCRETLGAFLDLLFPQKSEIEQMRRQLSKTPRGRDTLAFLKKYRLTLDASLFRFTHPKRVTFSTPPPYIFGTITGNPKARTIVFDHYFYRNVDVQNLNMPGLRVSIGPPVEYYQPGYVLVRFSLLEVYKVGGTIYRDCFQSGNAAAEGFYITIPKEATIPVEVIEGLF